MSETSDIYHVISKEGESVYREKASKFIALAFPVSTEEEVKEVLGNIRKKYHDANHHYYAYCLGPGPDRFRFSDDGEPSGSAGRPIYGQLLSKAVSDTLVIVVRYFGGTKLGIPGLIHAYRQAASEALVNSGISEKIIKERLEINFPYERMNDIMRIQKEEDLDVLGQTFEKECRIVLGVRKSRIDRVLGKLKRYHDIYSLLHQ